MKLLISLKYPNGTIKSIVKTFKDEKHRANYSMLMFRKGIKIINENEVK